MSNVAMMMGLSSSAGGLDITDVFSTYLWTSDSSSSITVNNGIDLDGEGGMVWIKSRSDSVNHVIVDTERVSGTTDNYLIPNGTNAQTAHTNEFGSFTSTGFTVPYNNEAGYTNFGTREYASWTWRKAPKFFDVVTYTGNGGTQTINHNLDCEVGTIIVKCTSLATNWHVLHRSLGPDNGIKLNSTGAADPGDTTYWNSTTPSSSSFTVSGTAQINGSGQTYVAYVFAHNEDLIQCGSYTGTGNGVTMSVDLGWSPQWIMIKRTDGATDWRIIDTVRGIPDSGNAPSLRPNSTGDEQSAFEMNVTDTGFSTSDGSDQVNASGGNYIYMAIKAEG